MNFKKKWVVTKDGSSTLRLDELRETYHSLHGAVVESEFVYIERGLRFWQQSNPNANCNLFEMGYGTGLVAYLTFLYESKNPIHYTSIEAYPLHIKELQKLNYSQRLNSESKISFSEFSAFSWEIEHSLSPLFSFVKNQILFQQFTATRQFDLIFYDAFGAHAQPELWEKKWIKKCHDMLNKGGVWVSFCAKGSVRRALQEVGFTVERLAGPPGKREMLRAIKP